MKKNILIPIVWSLIVGLVFVFTQTACEPEKPEPNDSIVAYKPNIYIYPEKSTSLQVNIEFPQGGQILASIPEYGEGWDIQVDNLGRINNTYDFLFYESSQPDVWQKQYGWLVPMENLESFFSENLSNYGFNENEKKDFLTYWTPKLTDSKQYAIYPQTMETIEKVIKINFSQEPETFFRLFYLIKAIDNNDWPDIQEPKIIRMQRQGYYAVEWGVLL